MTEPALTKTSAAPANRKLNRIPLATYRLQLGADLTLDQVTALLPYLEQLGVSDVYLSPLFRARAESSHGYDVVDHGTIDPAIGDMQSFARMAGAAREANMGVLLDVVPNHMGINDPANVWWNDVLENGEGSCFADFFDIEWHPHASALQDKILLPFLGEPFGKVLENGELKVIYRERRLQLEYGTRRFPLAPPTWPHVLDLARRDEALASDNNPVAASDRAELNSIVTQLHNLPPGSRRDPSALDERYREQKIAARRLEQLVSASAEIREALDRAVGLVNGEPGNPRSFDRLEQLIDDQWYRLAYWRVASDEINYRRFFDVSDLAAVRVDDPRVFEQVHRLIGRLLEAGLVTGLRIDHPDGLRDPLSYFKSLQALYRTSKSENESANNIYILAEKILAGDEPLSTEWPISGTTGYDLLNIIGRAQVCGDGLKELRAVYRRLTGLAKKPAEVVYESRRTVLLTTMASELQMLAVQLYRLARQHRASRDFTQPVLEQALREVLASMTVYRTYARDDSWDVSEADYRTVSTAVRMAKRRNRTMAHSVFDFIASILLLEHPPTLTAEQAEERRRFALKFQQVSGPVAAKGVEDTAFYRYYPLASLNEVGGELDATALTVDAFHCLMHYRRATWPHSLSATSTHDSKRGEDFRARLHVISEIPQEWEKAFNRWHMMNVEHLGEYDGESVPEANEEYFIYQTLVGTWPLEPFRCGELEAYRDRILQYLEKALREGKVHTSWVNPAESYENAVKSFVTAILSPERELFANDLGKFVARIAPAGFVNSLAQLLLKMALPGVPDFYRGTELWDFNLVDPDNRRPVDYDARRHRLRNLWSATDKDLPTFARELADRWPNPDIKLWITSSGLQLRRELHEVFTFGKYIPLAAIGSSADHILAFGRRAENEIAICVVPRHVANFVSVKSRSNDQKSFASAFAADWGGTTLVLPEDFPAEWSSRLTGEAFTATACGNSDEEASGTALQIAELFAIFPVALLTSPLP